MVAKNMIQKVTTPETYPTQTVGEVQVKKAVNTTTMVRTLILMYRRLTILMKNNDIVCKRQIVKFL